jgi:hypothetical protein
MNQQKQNDMKASLVEYDETSLFIGLTTLPLHKDSYDFYEKSIKANFDDYKKRIREFHQKLFSAGETEGTKKKLDKFDKLYDPNAYFLFGEFDLAVISLIDDFSFATKKFRPRGDDTFKYQVNTGLIPIIQVDSSSESFDIVRHYEDKVFKPQQKLPLIGITGIKLNNTLIVGNGKCFTDVIFLYLKKFLDEQKAGLPGKYKSAANTIEKKPRYEFLIIESLGWNEITLVSFSNAFEIIQDIVKELRNTNWADVKEKTCLENEKIDESSLLYEWISNERDVDRKEKIDASHPIIATNTQFGYHIEYCTQKTCLPVLDDEYMLSCPAEKANYFQVMWNIKSGHDAQFLRQAAAHFGGSGSDSYKSFEYAAGKNTIKYPGQLITFREYIEKIHQFLVSEDNAGDAEEGPITRHIYKIQTFLTKQSGISAFLEDIDKSQRNKRSGNHYSISKYLKQLTFKPDNEIRRIDDALRVTNISKILKGQVINMFHNFNEAIKDQLIFNNFIDLREALVNFLEKNGVFQEADFDKLSSEDINLEKKDLAKLSAQTRPAYPDSSNSANKHTNSKTEKIHDFVDSWDIAFWNRYFHSYYFTEANDFNLEHHGGIEMILAAYDSMYKIICKAIYDQRTPHQFVRVTILPSITSNSYSNQLNFIHLFLPSLYAASVVHEAANHFLFEIKHDLRLKITDNDSRTRSEQFEHFLTLLKTNSVDADRENIFFKIADDFLANCDYQSDAEKSFMKNFFGANLIRYLVTDYVTYKLQFEDAANETIGIDKFMGFHLGCIAQQTELYRVKDGHAYWEFDEFHFKAIYLRLTLMLIFFHNKKSHKQFAPFSVYEPHYQNHSAAIEKTASKYVKILNDSFSPFDLAAIVKAKITNVQESNSNNEFAEIISINKSFLDQFYNFFAHKHSGGNPVYKTSVLVRSRESKDSDGSNIVINKDGNTEVIDYHNIVLDPKGGAFSINIQKRGELHKLNCGYIKDIWNIAQKWRLTMYKKDRQADKI